jgi:uncharacterized repeat protein (TIGR01451 family)
VKRFRTAGRRFTSWRGDDGSRGRGTRRGLWVLTLLATAALVAFLPGTATGANPSANLDQCANGSPISSTACDASHAADWVNGNVGSSKATYFEGDSLPYRMLFDNLLPGSTHSVTIEWDTTKSGKHALDYLTTYNRTVGSADPCAGVSGCAGPADTAPIPKDPQVDNGSGSPVTQIPGVFSLFGGTITGVVRPSSVGSTTCTDANSLGAYCYSTGTGFTGDKSAAITIQFTATTANPVLAWAGHIATRKDWGFGNSAVAIPGSPYHTRLIDLDGVGGNQDRSLSAAAVIFPGQITVIKDAVPDSSTSFPFTDSGPEMTPSSFSLVDDGSGTQNKEVFSNLITFGAGATRTVTEIQPPPAHWALTNLDCSLQAADPSSSGTTSTALATGVSTIDLNEGDFATCTYTNTHQLASPALGTTPSEGTGSIGDTLTDNAGLSLATSDAGGTISFYLFKPGDNCSDLTTAVYSSTGVAVSGNGTYHSADGTTKTGSNVTTQAGTYHWLAKYSGDNNNNPASSSCSDEPVVIAPNDTTLTTDAGGTFRLSGDELPSVDLTDTATLHGGTSDATGTITFTLYGPDPTPDTTSDEDCSGEPVGTATAKVDKGGDDVAYTSSPPITVTEPGTYHWVASYDGDNNNNGFDSKCGDEGENPVVIAPHITVVKSALDSSDEQVIRNGDTANWQIQVINDGTSTLTDVHVTDEQAPGCARTSADIPGLASMPPAPAEGSTVSYTCSRDNNTASFTNVAVATGKPEIGEDVSAEDSSHVTVIHPAISVSKTPHTQTVAFAGTVTFTIGVKNTGDSVLTNVHVTDAQAPGCARTSTDIPQLASMAPGDELSYSCTVANVMADFTNVATAIGTPQVGPDVSATDSASVTVGPPPPPVTHPAISIVKDPKSQTVTVGKTATFKITVTNTGDVALTNVTVTDPLSPDCNRTIGTLAPGASTSYTCTRPDVRSSFTNVAVVTGTAGATTVRAQDTAPVTAQKPFVPKKVVPKVVSHKKPKATG